MPEDNKDVDKKDDEANAAPLPERVRGGFVTVAYKLQQRGRRTKTRLMRSTAPCGRSCAAGVIWPLAVVPAHHAST